MGQKLKTLKNQIELSYGTIRFVSTSWSFWSGRMSKSDKKWPSESGLKIGYFGYVCWDMEIKFVLSIININIKEQTQLEVN